MTEAGYDRTMPRRPSLPLPRGPLLLVILLLAGCFSGQRRPLFGGGPSFGSAPSAPVAPPPAPPARPYGDATEQALIETLRAAPTADRRALVVDELVARGELARPVLEAALAEELVLADVIDEALRRLDGGADPGAPVRSGEGLPDPPWVEAKYRLALDHYTHGDVYGALRTIDAVLALEPRTVQTPRLQRLRRRALEKLVRETILVAEVTADEPLLAPEQPLTGSIRLSNLSEETLTLRAGEQDEIGYFSVSFEELAPGGSRTRLHVEYAIPLDDDLTIEPGETYDLPFPVDARSHAALDVNRVGRYTLGGRLRPQTFLVGETPYSLFLPVLPQDVLVLHAAQRPLASDPTASFLEAVEGGLNGSLADAEAARQVFVSAVLMARDDLQGTVRALVTALNSAQGGLSEGICAALARVTGEPLGFTREEWLLWWKLRQTRPQADDEAR